MGNLTSAAGEPVADFIPEVAPGMRRRRIPPIVYYLHEGSTEVHQVEVYEFDAEQIALEVRERANVDAIEIPVGEVDEPQLAEVADVVDEMSAQGVDVRLRLPRTSASEGT